MKPTLTLPFVLAFSAVLLAAVSAANVPAEPAQRRQEASTRSLPLGSFSFGGLDPSISAALSSALVSASSYAATQTTIPFTSVSQQSDNPACPVGGILVNNQCCPSGQVINGLCYAGSTNTAEASATPTPSGGNNAAAPTSTMAASPLVALLICLSSITLMVGFF